MKILYFIDRIDTPGGVERVLSVKANYFVDKGYDVGIVTLEKGNKPPFFTFSPEIKIHYLNVQNNKIKNKEHIQKVTELIIEENPDICISMFGLEIYFLHSINHPCKKIVEYHSSKMALEIQSKNIIHKIYRKYLVKRIEKNLRKFSKVVLLTQEDQKSWDLNNSTVIYNPLIEKLSDEYADYSKKEVITLGRIPFVKGYDLLIDVWNIVHRKFPEWNLKIIGLGSENAEVIENKVKQLELNDVIEILPIVKNVEDYYLSSSIYVLSSRYEGFPMTLLEASSFGLPIVAWKCPTGPSEIVKHKESGLLSKYLDIQNLADQLMILMESEDKRRKFGIKSKENMKQFDIEVIINQWLQLFNELKISK
ncbi:poly(glycerol-phosphate) alpha-glucosyltransferase [Flavobacteriaceae bacterium UJ101]|nr:poly(glycerol-phosphate) alpha-glucosyltransferase [Flavobacteriaceae bacterium UJ101]